MTGDFRGEIDFWQSYRNKEIRWAPEEPTTYYGYFYYTYQSRYGGAGMVYGKTLPYMKKTELQYTELVDWDLREKNVV